MRPLYVLASTFTLGLPFSCVSIPDQFFSSANPDIGRDIKKSVIQSPDPTTKIQGVRRMKHGLRESAFILPQSRTEEAPKPVILETTNLDLGHPSPENAARELPRPLRLGLEWAGFISTGFGFWGLKDDCGDWHEGGDAAPGAKCVVAAIGTGATLVLAGADSWEYIATLTNGVNVQGQVADIPLLDYPLHRLPNGPFFPNDADRLNKRHDAVRQVENAISTKLGIEVRHIGMWDGNSYGSPKKREDKTEAWPMFAMERDGQDFHFAYMGRREDTGEHKFRLGHGPGINNEGNELRLKARQAFVYNTQYFDRGGLDIIGQSDIMKDNNHPEVQPDLERPDSYQWLYEQINCYMDGGSDEALKHHGLWFQVYDRNGQGNPGTLAAGAIAAFGPNTPSMISWMQSSGGIGTIEECSSIGPWKL